MKPRFLLLTFLLVFTILLSACVDQPPKQSAQVPIPDTVPAVSGTVEIHFPSVGKADAIIMLTANQTIVIDLGESDDGARVANTLQTLGRDHIDMLIITHFDKDHVGGFSTVSQRISIGKIYYSNYRNDRPECIDFYRQIEEEQMDALAVTEDIALTVDDIYMTIQPTKTAVFNSDASQMQGNDNDMSLLVSVWHGKIRMLFTGDAEDVRLREIMKSNVRAQFLKVPYHGNALGFSKGFFDAVRPEYAVICDSKKYPANATVLALLKNLNATTMCTREGDITLISDGKVLNMTQKTKDGAGE